MLKTRTPDRILLFLLGTVFLSACSDVKEPSIEVSELTIKRYENSCAECHGEGVGGAPRTGDSAAWAERMVFGIETVRGNAIAGFEGESGVMPIKGGRDDLTDEEINAITDYMVDISR